MKIALATSNTVPDWEVDDKPFHAALEERGIDATLTAWDDPTVRWSEFDACLIRTTWNYQEHRADFVRWIEQVSQQIPLFNPPGIIKWNTHKSYLRDLAEAGIATIPTRWLHRGQPAQIEELLDETGWTRAVIKPAIGATARETIRFAADDAGRQQAQQHIDRLQQQEDLLLQPYLSQVETHGETSAIFLGGSFSHAVRKIPKRGDYRVQDDFGASDQPVSLNTDETAFANAVIAVAPAGALYARVDFLQDDEGRPRLGELEMVEPSLFFRHSPTAAGRLAEALRERVALET